MYDGTEREIFGRDEHEPREVPGDKLRMRGRLAARRLHMSRRVAEGPLKM